MLSATRCLGFGFLALTACTLFAAVLNVLENSALREVVVVVTVAVLLAAVSTANRENHEDFSEKLDLLIVNISGLKSSISNIERSISDIESAVSEIRWRV